MVLKGFDAPFSVFFVSEYCYVLKLETPFIRSFVGLFQLYASKSIDSPVNSDRGFEFSIIVEDILYHDGEARIDLLLVFSIELLFIV